MADIASLRAPAPPAAPRRPPAVPASPAVHRRRRLVASLVALLLIALAIALPAVLFGAGGPTPPATGAASVVPADALAYVHVSTDSSRAQVPQAVALDRRLPGFYSLTDSVMDRLDAILGGGATLNYPRDIRPWIGKEAALALLDTTSSTAGSLIVLDVRDRSRAQALLRRTGATAAGTYRGVAIKGYPTGTELAFVKHYLVLGQDASVRSAIDVGTDSAPSLARTPAYDEAAAGEPADRVLDVYVSAAGVRRLLADATGPLGAIGALLSQPALTATTISVSPASGGVRVRVHGALAAGLLKLTGRPEQFEPRLPDLLPTGSMLLLDAARLDTAAPRILDALGSLGIAGGVQPLISRLGNALSAQSVHLGNVLALLHGEAAVALIPSAAGAGPAPAIIAHVANQAQARQTLANLEVPLQQLFPTPGSGPGLQAEWNDEQVAGVTVHQLGVAPGLHLDYAVFDGLAVVSTSADAIGAIAHHTRPMSADAGYRTAVGDQAKRVTSLVSIDFSQLLSLAEQTGLTHGARVGAIGPDLARIHAVGLTSTAGENDTTAELFLQIS
ncbi:MAG: DUF3352 domain-containing protein [Solirubrobacteraceae bacterium]